MKSFLEDSLPFYMNTLQHHGSSSELGVLVDPIIVHSSPGSKPSKQLCSLLATMLKFSGSDFRTAPESVWLAQKAQAYCNAVLKVTCAVMGAATRKGTACQASGGTSSSAGSATAGGTEGPGVTDIMLP